MKYTLAMFGFLAFTSIAYAADSITQLTGDVTAAPGSTAGLTVDQVIAASDTIEGIKADRTAISALQARKEKTIEVYKDSGTTYMTMGTTMCCWTNNLCGGCNGEPAPKPDVVYIPKDALIHAIQEDADAKAASLRILGVR
jgi:hypothetical protein